MSRQLVVRCVTLPAMSSSARRSYKALRSQALAGDAEAIHRVRKLARRAEVMARVSGAPKRDRRAWQAVRRAASELRDHDVTGELIRQALAALPASKEEQASVAAAWAQRRVALLTELSLPRRVPQDPERPGRNRWRRSLERAQRQVLARVPPRDGRVHAEAWHDWRKALKRYRAVLDMRAKAPDELLDLLQVLGDAQDAQTLLTLALREPALRPHRAALSSAAQARRRTARAAAWTHWAQVKAALLDDRPADGFSETTETEASVR